MSENEKKKIGYKDIFSQIEYLKMMVAALVNRFGDSVDAIASTWIVYEITGSAAWSAIIFGINRVPSIFITPFAGAWVEGRNKKNIMIITDIIRAICVALVATGYLFGFLNEWILVLTTVIISTVEAFRGPANTALTPNVLERKYYEHGMALMSTVCSIVELIGMALAAGIIALIGTAGAIYLDMITFIISALVILTVNTKEEKKEKQRLDIKGYAQTLVDGLVYVKKDEAVLFFCGIAVFLNGILVPINSLQAPLVSEILKGGAEVLSVLGIAMTIGMMLGTAVYPSVSKVLNARMFLVLCSAGIAFYYIGFVLCKPLYDSTIFMCGYVAISSVLCGVLVSMFNTFLNVEFLKKIDEDYLARASSVMTSISVASVPVVSAIVSALVVFVSTETFFVVAGALSIFVCPLFLRSKVMDMKAE